MIKIRHLIFISAVAFLYAPWTTVSAGVCDNFTGQALGLCQAGVAVGCDTQTGPAQACEKIENNFADATGVEAPWLVKCICDYSSVSLQTQKSGGPWNDTTENNYSCTASLPETDAFSSVHTAYLSDFMLSPKIEWHTMIRTTLAYRGENGEPTQMTCTIVNPNTGSGSKIGIFSDIDADTPEVKKGTSQEVLNMARACRKDVIAYANAFIALNPGVIDNIDCPQ